MIRPYSQNDYTELILILQQNTPKFFDPSEEKDFLDYLEIHSSNYYVFEKDAKIIAAGGINYGFDNGKTARISWDMVRPENQGQRIGTQLVNFRINEIMKHPEIKKIVVRTTQLAFRFYEKLGFHLNDIQKDYWAKDFDLFLMEILI